ncbi:MAG: HmuY family protein [Prevotellaceae bacterium]|jgi:hypothetical protein|nr:HmuY family protein [Prevotellaceae bacterium]
MKKFKLFLMLPLLMVALVGVQSCSDDDDPPQPLTGEEVEINVVSSWGTWNYFSFAEGKVIGTGAATAEADAEWKVRTDWDIAFTRLYARTNSGISGNGQGGVKEIPTDGSTSNGAAVFANLIEAPTTGYVVDATDDLMISMGGPAGPTYYNAGTCTTVNPWLTIAMPVVATPKVFVIKTADGKYAKIYLKAYQNANGDSGYITMEYVYQASGSTNLLTE